MNEKIISGIQEIINKIDSSRTVKQIYDIGEGAYIVNAINENNFSKTEPNCFMVANNKAIRINPGQDPMAFQDAISKARLIYDV